MRQIWDLLLVKGEIVLFRVGVWLVVNSYDHFKDADSSEMLPIIKNFSMSSSGNFLSELGDNILSEQNYYDLLDCYLPKQQDSFPSADKD